jgi:hypothetical protein
VTTKRGAGLDVFSIRLPQSTDPPCDGTYGLHELELFAIELKAETACDTTSPLFTLHSSGTRQGTSVALEKALQYRLLLLQNKNERHGPLQPLQRQTTDHHPSRLHQLFLPSGCSKISTPLSPRRRRIVLVLDFTPQILSQHSTGQNSP